MYFWVIRLASSVVQRLKRGRGLFRRPATTTNVTLTPTCSWLFAISFDRFFTVAWTWYSLHHFNLNVELRLRFAEVWDDQLGLPGAVGYLAGVCLCQHSSSPPRLGNSSDHKWASLPTTIVTTQKEPHTSSVQEMYTVLCSRRECNATQCDFWCSESEALWRPRGH